MTVSYVQAPWVALIILKILEQNECVHFPFHFLALGFVVNLLQEEQRPCRQVFNWFTEGREIKVVDEGRDNRKRLPLLLENDLKITSDIWLVAIISTQDPSLPGICHCADTETGGLA